MKKLFAFIFDQQDLFQKVNLDLHKDWVIDLFKENEGTEVMMTHLIEILTILTKIFVVPNHPISISYLKPEFVGERRECLSEVYLLKPHVVEGLRQWSNQSPGEFKDEMGYSIYLDHDVLTLLQDSVELQKPSGGYALIESLIEEIIVGPLDYLVSLELNFDVLYIHFKIYNEALWVFISLESVEKHDFAF